MTGNEAGQTPRRTLGTLLRTRLSDIMRGGIGEGVFPGGVVLVRHRDEVVVHEAFGHSHTYQSARSRISEPIETTPDTVYDLASITKVFTATCVMQLVDEGKLRLDDRVQTHLPRFGRGDETDVTVRHLLSHVSGLPRLRLWEDVSTCEARIEKILALSPDGSPGTAFEYSDMNFLVLGVLVQTLERRPLDQVMASRILDPLGLLHTAFGAIDVRTARVAATEDASSIGRNMVHGEVHDENAWSLRGLAGHAGLFGTAHDVSTFGQMYLNSGVRASVRLLQPETVAEMTRNQIPELGNRGLGWQLNAPYYMGRLASSHAYGHTGFTGTSIVIDPRRELVVVLLTNRVHPSRNGPDIDPVRRAVSDAVCDVVDAT